MKLYDDVVISGASILGFIILVIIVRIIGRKAAFEKFIYLITFHWLLEIIIAWRNGKDPKYLLDQEFTEFIENDEDFVRKAMNQEDVIISQTKKLRSTYH